VVYQIYLRSFADGNGDGIGDLWGLVDRLPVVAELGVDALWLTPFYPSPLADGGYDVSDYRDVDPRLGTLAQFDVLVRRVHELGLRLIIDVVPNHTSDQHPWFRQALAADAGSPERARYLFRDGTGPDQALPPSDWLSHFGGSAWEPVGDGQWYLHLFSREQPDLNWDHPEVRQSFLETLRFWADRGVDGFRVDVAHALAKDMSEPLRSQPHRDARLPLDGSDPLYDREEVHEIYRSWRSVLDEYDPPRMAVAETWTPTSFRTYLYARPDELGQVFDFSLLKSAWNRQSYQQIISRSLADHRRHAHDGGGLTWVLSSHDVPRHASRLAAGPGVDLEAWFESVREGAVLDRELGRRRARAATLMMLALPGTAYLYQGEELGLPEVVDLPDGALRDPIWLRSGRSMRGRDGCRVPLPWNRAASFGFGTGGAWLPQPDWFGEYAYESQQIDPDSTLALYQAALRLRRTLSTDDAHVTWLDDNPLLLRFRRSNGWQCVVNFSSHPQPLPPGRVLLTSAPMGADPGSLPADTGAWLADGR
jgi:alpha-glucosidase